MLTLLYAVASWATSCINCELISILVSSAISEVLRQSKEYKKRQTTSAKTKQTFRVAAKLRNEQVQVRHPKATECGNRELRRQIQRIIDNIKPKLTFTNRRKNNQMTAFYINHGRSESNILARRWSCLFVEVVGLRSVQKQGRILIFYNGYADTTALRCYRYIH